MIIDNMHPQEMNQYQLGIALDEEVAASGLAIGDCSTPDACDAAADACEPLPTAGILRAIAARMRELNICSW